MENDRLAAAERGQQLAERRAMEARRDAKELAATNTQLNQTLRQARDKLALAKEQLAAMSQPPATFGTVVAIGPEGTVDVTVSGRSLRVACDPTIQAAMLTPGSQVLLNESMVVVATGLYREVGEIAVVRELLGEPGRVIISGTNVEDQVVKVAPALQRSGLRHGDSVLVDRRAFVVYDKVARHDLEDLVLEEIPDLDYSAIGGATDAIQAVRDAVELPFLHRDMFSRYGLTAPKGVLLYGPPGCGKTMIAKAVAHSLAQRMSELTGGHARSFFLNVKGPELLNKYVGETERQIRIIFQRARERANEGMPVIVFFDEMDSLFRTRGSGVSSDVENTIVPQLLSEIDGVEGLENVIIIGASNREDLIDPAILRPGRLDVKIKLQRPDAVAAKEIFSKYLTSEIPIHEDDLAAHNHDRKATVSALIDSAVTQLYATTKETEFLEVSYASGATDILYFKDFASGAMMNNIVAKAKKAAIKDELAHGKGGVSSYHLRQAIRAEFIENEDLPNTTNPDDWARISGKRGERIVHIRTLVGTGN
ncbi:MAG: proteasome ATPase [Propionibacteriaceae bacterium]